MDQRQFLSVRADRRWCAFGWLAVCIAEMAKRPRIPLVVRRPWVRCQTHCHIVYGSGVVDRRRGPFSVCCHLVSRFCSPPRFTTHVAVKMWQLCVLNQVGSRPGGNPPKSAKYGFVNKILLDINGLCGMSKAATRGVAQPGAAAPEFAGISCRQAIASNRRNGDAHACPGQGGDPARSGEPTGLIAVHDAGFAIFALLARDSGTVRLARGCAGHGGRAGGCLRQPRIRFSAVQAIPARARK